MTVYGCKSNLRSLFCYCSIVRIILLRSTSYNRTALSEHAAAIMFPAQCQSRPHI